MKERREILRPVEVGKILGLRRSRVYALLKEGVLPSVKVAGRIWIPRAAFEAWLVRQSERALAANQAGGTEGRMATEDES